MALAFPDTDDRPGEAERVEAWRLRTLLAAGYTIEDAEKLAGRGDVDLHRAVELLARGCPCELAGQILI